MADQGTEGPLQSCTWGCTPGSEWTYHGACKVHVKDTQPDTPPVSYGCPDGHAAPTDGCAECYPSIRYFTVHNHRTGESLQFPEGECSVESVAVPERMRLDRIVTSKDVVRSLPKLLSALRDDPEPFVVTKRGKPVAMLYPVGGDDD